jgi:hypothetical protein
MLHADPVSNPAGRAILFFFVSSSTAAFMHPAPTSTAFYFLHQAFLSPGAPIYTSSPRVHPGAVAPPETPHHAALGRSLDSAKRLLRPCVSHEPWWLMRVHLSSNKGGPQHQVPQAGPWWGRAAEPHVNLLRLAVCAHAACRPSLQSHGPRRSYAWTEVTPPPQAREGVGFCCFPANAAAPVT